MNNYEQVTQEVRDAFQALCKGRVEAAVKAEREACAKACEDAISSIWEFHPEYVNQVGKNVCTNLAAAIRARSNT